MTKKKNERQKVLVKSDEVDLGYMFNCMSLDDCIDYLVSLKELYLSQNAGYTTIVKYIDDYYSQERAAYHIDVYRDETDEEYEDRLNEEKKTKMRLRTERKMEKQKQEDAERKEYERLKNKFGDA